MGFQVGRICYETSQQATDVVMSQVLPSIGQDGQLFHPVKKDDAWYMNQEVVSLTFPECDPLAYFHAGLEISKILIIVFVAIYGIRLIANFIMKAADDEREV